MFSTFEKAIKMQQQISYDIDWVGAYDAWKASGLNKAKFWKTELKHFCRGNAFPTYNRFVKRLQDVEQRRQYLASCPPEKISDQANEVADFVLQLKQEESGEAKASSVSSSSNAKLISVVEVQFPSGMKVKVKTTDPTALIHSLMQKENLC